MNVAGLSHLIRLSSKKFLNDDVTSSGQRDR